MSWKPLQLSSSAGAQIPPLLISFEFNHDSYLIRLTDLTNTWAERIDRDAIIERSREENTSIDPSEDDDQLSIFLDKIKLGLAGERDTSLSLQVGMNNGSGPLPQLRIHVKVPLPGGLKDLKWRYQLKPQLPQETAETLLIPSLIAFQEKREGVRKLVELLEEKDAVIQKLVDALENQGTDLGTIFHQAAGRPGRKVDRKKASEKIRGLKIFDVDDWRRGLRFDKIGDTWALLNNLFGDGDISLNTSMKNDLGRGAQQSSWWDRMHGKTAGTSGNSDAKNATDLMERDTKQEAIPPEDDFQVQSTPPHLLKSRPKPDVSMDDDEDLDVPSQLSRVPDPDSLPISHVHAPGPNRTTSPSPSPSPSRPANVQIPIDKLSTKQKAQRQSPPSQNADDGTEDDETTSKNLSSTKTLDDDVNDNDTTDDDVTSSPPSKRQQTPQKLQTHTSPPAKKKGKLGKLGGRKAPSLEPDPEVEVEAEVEPQATEPRPKRGMLGKLGGKKRETISTLESDAQSSVWSPRKKLGTVGGKKAGAGGVGPREDTTPGEENRGRGREQTREEVEKAKGVAQPRETSRERADRKREVLKRELEAKSTAPVKKKRKF
ncbi:hypothetical protein DSL72_003883 [Monilinia vaccinii-corymbosi]|uniref:Non-homologous end-joining factor 1 n=1 Tax=Monilinia vaccinii-corymbosi TaxID=61207 RepID=A0A8A3P8B8_9HELO|nr:hypothetical protein DSL72_003883 [Monilinia vaccinii-corymbosi]